MKDCTDIESKLIDLHNFLGAKRRIILDSINNNDLDGNMFEVYKHCRTEQANMIVDIMDDINELIDEEK